MKKDSSSNNYSADSFIEDYQRQLKKKQEHGFSQNASYLTTSSESDATPDKDILPDLSVSMSHVENQLISQFREYKEIKKKLDDAKRQLHLSSQIQVSVDNLKELERVYSQQKKSLDDTYRESKEKYDSELNHLKRDKERMIAEKDHVIQMLKHDQIKAQYDVQVTFEQDQLLQSEGFFFNFSENLGHYSELAEKAKQDYDDFVLELEDKKEATKKRFDFDCDQLTSEFNLKRDELDHLLADKKSDILKSVDSMNVSFQEQVDDTQRVLSEQYDCLKFEFESIHGVFHMLIQSSEQDLEQKKKQSVDTLLEFSEQLDQKRDMWEFEKVSVLEGIDQEKFRWNEEKKHILHDLENKKIALTDEIDQLKKQFLEEKESWKLQQESLIHNYEEKKETLVRDINVFESRSNEYEMTLLNRSEKLESYELLMYEREQEFECVRRQMMVNLDHQRQQKLDNFELEFLEKKDTFSSQLKQLEDRQKLDFSQRLDSFEKDLSQRRRLFEEDLVNRRQKIMEDCKRDQKVEFDHLLDFEKDKHMKQQKALLDQVASLKEELSQKDSLVMDQVQDYQEQIKDLQDEKLRLESELSSIEDLTRKKVIGSYEDKYKQSLDLYKQDSQKEIQLLKSSNLTLDSDLKKKELELRNFQLQVKRLESQLNKYLIDNKATHMSASFESKKKVVRSHQYKRGL
tara:strand:+ start:349 stop:2403 length:2055 start_codon:yes stop_codon:yes gene_type:complete